MSRTRPLAMILLGAVLVAFSGALRAAEPEAGTVFVVGGVSGLDPIQLFAPWMLPKAGVPHRIEVFEWTHGKGHALRDLQDIRYLLKQADRLAELVLETRSRRPDQPIYLVGHSAGAGVILAAAEKLPPASVERIILMSAAVSQDYDLRNALRAVRCEVVSFNSTYDRICLELCTSVFGTADRVYGPAAGLDGFRVPPDLDAEDRRLYERLVQVPWRLEMIAQGIDGSHHGPCMPVFLAHKIAPWLMP